MQLEAVRLLNWQNFIDSGWVNINKPVTTLVGKNESGKTAFIEALYRLNPAYSHDSKIDKNVDYPRWRKVTDEKYSDLDETSFIIGKFSLELEERSILEEMIKAPLPDLVLVDVVRTYGNKLFLKLLIDEKDAALKLMEAEEIKKVSNEPESLDGVFQIAKSTKSKGIAGLKGLKNKINRLKKVINAELTKEMQSKLMEYLPVFFRYSHYSELKGSFYLKELLERINKAPESLSSEDMTTIELLKLAGMDGPELISEDSERRIASLEAAASNISEQVFKYWSQNQDLKVRFETQERIKNDSEGNPSHIDTKVDVRLEDLRHGITTNFEKRSSGFRWFFSFIAAFSSFKNQENVIVLLDEPGHSLHGRAQNDFLKFVDEVLAPNNQVFYTSHSPFMVDPSKIDRVRIAEDRSTRENPDAGAIVLNDINTKDPDSIFPIKSVLSYDLANNMFSGDTEYLVVKSISDFMYIEIVSDYLKDLGRKSLDARLNIVPLGDLKNITTFVALNDSRGNFAVLMDSATKEMPIITYMLDKGLFPESKVVSISQIIDKKEGDVEDLFNLDEYLEMFNNTFNQNLSKRNIDTSKPLINEIEKLAGKFDREEPVSFLLKNKYAILPKLSEETIKRFENLFHLINQNLP